MTLTPRDLVIDRSFENQDALRVSELVSDSER